MNTGQIVTRALNRAGLSVSDLGMRDLAKDYLDEIIQEIWESKHWGFRKRTLSISTTASTEEVSLDKRVRVQNIVPNTMRGSSPVRQLTYQPSIDFYKQRPFTLATGTPYYFRDGNFKGFSTDPSSASVITFVSSLTNYTTGTLTVVNGSRRVSIATGAVSVDMVGRYIRVGTDVKAYKISSIEFKSTSVFYIDSPYEGTNSTSATFVLGDIAQTVTVMGYVSGQLQEEELLLNGSSSVATTKSFTSLVRISKSDKTHGYITATSNSGVVTNAILDPGDNDIDVQTVKLYPIPSATETISYEAYITHPHLYKDSDAPLIPSEFHNLLVLDLYIRLESEWNKAEVSQVTIDRRSELFNQMNTIDNNTDNWTIQQETYEDSEKSRFRNLPPSYEDDGFI